MELWHLTVDTPRVPHRVAPGERVVLHIGTWPVEPGQSVWVRYQVERPGAAPRVARVEAVWRRNVGANSEWRAELGPFPVGTQVHYTVHGRSAAGDVSGPGAAFRVGPRLYLALLWHQHQPLYRDADHPRAEGSFVQPWVRLHVLRDYYSMVALIAEHPGVHLTINLTPVLLWQVEEYVERGATDVALDFTLRPVEVLSEAERGTILRTFFDADWHNQIFPHPRYKELFIQRREGQPFGEEDLRDLQMWFNLAWFGKEFREGPVELVTGETVRVHRFVEQGRDFSQADIEAMVAEQYRLLRAMVPVHRQLQERGQIEVSTTPFYHPILPLLVDTDGATLDRPGTTLPPRFAYPEDAEAHVRLAVDHYRHCFGRQPRGMWPAEGAVSQSVIPLFARHGVRWLATDRGVLARSGRWGYRADDPDVLCQPYRVEEEGTALSVFFRDTELADAIGFRYHSHEDPAHAAREFLEEIRMRFARRATGDEDRILTVALDGENAWGAYRDDARPFLHALYGLLEADTEIQTVTFSEYLEGNPARQIGPHPPQAHPRVHDLFTGSWIDEAGSLPGVDLGTWIGEPEENRAWELLGQAREVLGHTGATPLEAPAAFDALYAAQGSDWFWWFGADQESGVDEEFDALFRTHLRNVYRGLDLTPPEALDRYLVTRVVVWTFTEPVERIQAADRLAVRTHCAGVISWWTDGTPAREEALVPAGGVMAGVHQYHLTLGPFAEGVRALRFRFRCTEPGCPGTDACCVAEPARVEIL